MDFSWLNLLYVLVPSLAGGFIQTVTGFGFGVVVMMFFPIFLGVPQASALSAGISLILSTSLVWKLRKDLNLKKLWFPMGVDMIFGVLSIVASKYIDLSQLKIWLSVFMVLMALYLLFLSGKFAVKANKKTAFICSSLGGLASGFFGMGGPPLLPWFLAEFGNDKYAYIVSLQFMFWSTGLVNTAARAASGIFTWEVLLYLLPGIAGMLLGQVLGLRYVKKINAEQLKRIVYIFLGIAGIINFVTCLLK